MIAGEVGEGGGGERQTIEAELIEPVARRFERDMLNAGLGERREIAMEGDRIRCCEAAGLLDAGSEKPDRAEARGFVAERCPDLAQENGHRRLAVCASDGGDR